VDGHLQENPTSLASPITVLAKGRRTIPTISDQVVGVVITDFVAGVAEFISSTARQRVKIAA
jgi:hypothetical protein